MKQWSLTFEQNKFEAVNWSILHRQVGLAIRVCGLGLCHVDTWIFGYMGWPEPNLFSKRIKNSQL